MKINVSNEIIFSTARSGGKGGQNVNKVETMVDGRWNVMESALFSTDEKHILTQKLAAKINKDGFLHIKSQTARTQLANKAEVIRKMNELIGHALIKKKARIATQPSKATIEKRIQTKKITSEVKQTRKKLKPGDWA